MNLTNNAPKPRIAAPIGSDALTQPLALQDKVSLITGGGNGIGRAIAKLFAQEGSHVILADIDEEGANDAAAEIVALGSEALAVRADIANEPNVNRMFKRAMEWGSRIDVLVNNAGIGLNRPFLETTLQEWNRMLNVVLTGTFLCSQSAARLMVPQRSGTIINVASISGQRGAQGRAAYGAAKAGVIQLTQAMAVELAPHGIRVNAISPGPVDTSQSRATHTLATRNAYVDRIPLRRYGECDEIASAVLFLASDESSFVHGHVLNVDGGFRAAGLMFDATAD